MPGTLAALKPGALAHLVQRHRSLAPDQTQAVQIAPVPVAMPAATGTAKSKSRPQPGASSPVELRQKTQRALDLADPALALLCVPSSFMDCTHARTRLESIASEERGLLYLHKTGRIWATDEQKRPVEPHPYASLYDAPWPTHWRRIQQVRIEVRDDAGCTAYITSFGASARSQQQQGPVLVYATVQHWGNAIYLNKADAMPQEAFGRVWPRYSTPGSTTNEAGVRALVEYAQGIDDAPQRCIHELVRTTLLDERQLLAIAQQAASQHPSTHAPAPVPQSMTQWLQWMHTPPTLEHANIAVACARALAVQGIRHAARRANERAPHVKSALPLTQSHINQAKSAQPEKLTPDQNGAIDRIIAALQKPAPLMGLLTGDVGTGKTLTFAIPAVAAHLCGANVCIIAPTDILADQIYRNLRRRFPFARLERVLTGRKIADPSAILIGTAGLSTVAAKIGYDPGLLIIDEQHKLATEMRSALCRPWTHVLEASATPIPRSLASSLFAGMEVFTLNSAPVKRDIRSHLLDERQRPIITKALRKTVISGARAALIYPRVNTTAESGTSVLQAAQTLAEHFPDQVGALHGKMKGEEIQTALQALSEGTKPIVVASTVMETGIDVPDIRVLVVRDADNFGAAQLHQLRGRLARNGGCADFYMLVRSLDDLPPETMERLAMVRDTCDGYALAEADMRQRGFGDLTGEAQSGAAMSAFRLLPLQVEDFACA